MYEEAFSISPYLIFTAFIECEVIVVYAKGKVLVVTGIGTGVLIFTGGRLERVSVLVAGSVRSSWAWVGIVYAKTAAHKATINTPACNGRVIGVLYYSGNKKEGRGLYSVHLVS